jgi:hypothetical protein
LPPEKARRVKETVTQPPEVEPEDRSAFWESLRILKRGIDSSPAAHSEEELAALEARARRLGSCETVQVLGLRSYRRRLLGDLPGAECLLSEAWALAPLCPLAVGDLNPCELDLQRRTAVLEAALGRTADAIRRAQIPVDGYERLGGAGHDLDGDGLAKALYARGDIRQFMGDFDGSAADFAVCLDRFPRTSPLWLRVQQGLADVLLHSGPLGQLEAWKLMSRLRLSMRRQDTVVRAHFLWTDGQLTIVLGKQRGVDKLKESLKIFRKETMPYHCVGVAHDLCLALYPRGREILRLLGSLEPLPRKRGEEPKDFLGRAFVADPRLGTAFFELYSLAKRPQGNGPFAAALEKLRLAAAAAVSLPPCLLAPIPTSR